MAEKVLARLDAARDVECHLALVGNHLIDTPYSVRVPVLVDLEPLQARDVALGRVRDLSTAGCIDQNQVKCSLDAESKRRLTGKR